MLENRKAKMARVVDLTCADDDDAQSTSTTKSGSKSGYTTPSADKSTSGIFKINFIEVINTLI